MKLLLLSPSSYFCLFLVLVGFIRAIQLYYSSTRDLRIANKDDNWYQQPPSPKTVPAELQHAAYRNATGRMADQPDQIFYFVQVSDLHISQFQPQGHTIHFLHFLQSALPVISPEFVVVTGDLTDAKDESRTVSAQYPQEWQVYKSAVEQGANGTTWYDMRGNHDCFDLVSWQAESNLYKDYGKSAKVLDDGKGVYSWQVSKTFGNYQFVAVDSCPRKGPSRPFNFFGYLTTNTMNRLVSKIMPSTFNHTFLFSHYPTTTMFPGVSSEGYTFSDLADHFSIYFCGHLHKLAAGLGEVLKSYRRGSDSLELEVADMKDHGAYRIVAVDHDLISFVDIELPIAQIPPVTNIVPLTEDNKIIWPEKIHPAPVVLITNPKDSRYTLPTKEPLHESRLSTHIRLLIFSEFAPESLKIRTFVDDKHHAYPAKFIGSIDRDSNMPLWAILWDPVDFDDYETHYLRIEVTAPDQQVGVHEVPFRMDNMRVKIQGGTGEWIIWARISSLVRFLSVFAVTAMLITITVPKIYNDYEKSHQRDARHNLRNKTLLSIHEINVGINRGIYAGIQKHIFVWVHRILQFPEEQPYVWALCFICLLGLLTLPWFRAAFIPSGKDEGEKMGFFYLWGLLFEKHQWVPLDTWLYAIFQLTFNVGIFILYFIWKSTSAYQLTCKGSGQQHPPSRLVCDRVWFQALVLVYWVWRVQGLWDLATFYGGVYPTLVFNLLVWWLIGVAVVLVMGKNGLYESIKNRHQTSEPVGVALEICPSCVDAVGGVVPDDEEPIRDHFFVSTAGQDEEQVQQETRGLLFDGDGSSSDSSNSSRVIRRNNKRD
ncbi:Metallo-dependent phosphatase-like protein [Mucor lusitanicus]|uniref:Uncharacterized protein n=2 Tax=Mucor circinelloides f. lusitanicus TaxID=29924 RepID=A0A168GHF9_MUCCL|nr:Metallo-dependent phosphatase-like protein [Mucor lusitanicus]OAC97690.1 hypothetical protein MUCCIDRAFT_93167 [Mucor lusitanicus CBS 277.49]